MGIAGARVPLPSAVVMGAVEVDLRQAGIATEAVLHLSVIMTRRLQDTRYFFTHLPPTPTAAPALLK